MNVSVRVAWHDDGWAEREKCNACVDERSCKADSGYFMSSKPMKLETSHPYRRSPMFKNLTETTEIEIPPYSLIGRNFRWTLKEHVQDLVELYPIDFDAELEANLQDELGFPTSWVTHGDNQKNIFDYFYGRIELGKSLVFPYSKRCSLTDTAGRIILGVGHAKKVGDLASYDGETEVKPRVWERPIEHSIRDDRQDGFLLPFDDLKKYLEAHPEEDPDDFLVISPPEYFLDFSYATDRVSLDATIWTLSQLLKVVKKYQTHRIGGDWAKCIAWLENEIEKAWSERPEYPGLGALLQAAGFKYGEDLAEIIEQNANEDVWETITKVIDNPKDYWNTNAVSEHVLKQITGTLRDAWKVRSNKNLAYWKLLAHFDLSYRQMKYFVENANEISAEVLENPYRLYERSYRWASEDNRQAKQLRIRLQQVDYALFPDGKTTDFSVVQESDDRRRLRAWMVYYLERAAENGNTLAPQKTIFKNIQEDLKDIDISGFTEDLFEVYEDFFGQLIAQKYGKYTDEGQTTSSSIFLKLRRLQKFDEEIKKFTNSHLKNDLEVKCDWLSLIKKANSGKNMSSQDEDAMKNIAKIMENLASHRLSILTGGAGTGKTTAIAAFCSSPMIEQEGVLILAPTGKARMVLSQKLSSKGIRVSAQTVAQFLLHHKCWNPLTGEYSLNRIGVKPSDYFEYNTVIIDECSMLTSEMMGALMFVLSAAKRVVLIGDPNQLPPIGPGKPFYDLVRFLKNRHPDYYNKLTYNWRQKDAHAERLDADLAQVFTDGNYVADDIFDKIANDSTNVEFVRYNELNELPEKLLDVLVRCTGMQDVDDYNSFDKSIGGYLSQDKKWMNFVCNDQVESWQIITPYRNKENIGSFEINKFIHEKYRPDNSNTQNRRRTPCALGEEKIMYGDKVINIKNHTAEAFPKDGAQNYIANGEIGLVTSLHRSFLNVAFSSQPGFLYGFYAGRNFEGPIDLELGYALTIHKSQGSTYKNTILLLNVQPDKISESRFINREMIYTALSRQSNKIYILYNAEPYTLSGLAYNSGIAERLTDLFEELSVVRYQNKDWDKNLIHITRGGIRVRSKSEVAIADLLYSYRDKLEFVYEKELKLGDKVRVPDFTIKLPSGKVVYWEHLGMLNTDSYRRAWERKRELYRKNGISEENGNLVTSRDEENGSIDMVKIEEKVKKLIEE